MTNEILDANAEETSFQQTGYLRMPAK